MGSTTHHSPASATSERARDVGARLHDPCEPARAGQPGAPRRHGPGRRGRPTARLRPRHREPHIPAQHAGKLRDPRVPDPVRPGLAPEPPAVALVRDLLPAHPARQRHCPAPGPWPVAVAVTAESVRPLAVETPLGLLAAPAADLADARTFGSDLSKGPAFGSFTGRPADGLAGIAVTDPIVIPPVGEVGTTLLHPSVEATATEPSVDPPHPKE